MLYVNVADLSQLVLLTLEAEVIVNRLLHTCV